MKGYVTNIQRFSLNDGDGIRTTVFLQGCNMRCEWCHNPETLARVNVPLYYARKCIGCGYCFAACSTGARMANFDVKLCINCGACAQVCYAGAIAMSGYEATVQDVVREVKQDQLYYSCSHGGVTFSGGEALCQVDFVKECVDALEEEGVSCALETNLLHSFERIAPVLKRMSLIMADIKLMDEAEHIRWTGVSNRRILENAQRLGEIGVPIIFRTPLIPGITDSLENLHATVAYVAKISGVRYYELLNFNPLGADKYVALRKNNAFTKARPLAKPQLELLRTELTGMGVEVRIS